MWLVSQERWETEDNYADLQKSSRTERENSCELLKPFLRGISRPKIMLTSSPFTKRLREEGQTSVPHICMASFLLRQPEWMYGTATVWNMVQRWKKKNEVNLYVLRWQGKISWPFESEMWQNLFLRYDAIWGDYFSFTCQEERLERCHTVHSDLQRLEIVEALHFQILFRSVCLFKIKMVYLYCFRH